MDLEEKLMKTSVGLVKTNFVVTESQSQVIGGAEVESYIVSMDGEMRVIDIDVWKELEKNSCMECSIITSVKDTVAEGYNSESGMHVLKGADEKFYLVHSYAGHGCGHDNEVIDVFDNFNLDNLIRSKRGKL